MDNPLVSVIIPNYNHNKFLDERILSVLNQTYQNFEVIILDDKSTDNSVEVINKYKDNQHVSHIVINKENSGSTFKQWYKGFELARGEIVWIAESDDSCDNTLLETLVKDYVNKNVVLAFCRSCKYDVQGNKSSYTHQAVLTKNITMSGKEFIFNYMIDRNSVANASSAIFNRNIAMSIDKQYMSMKGNGDWLFWLLLMEQGDVAFNTREMNFFRFHYMNTTKSLGNNGISAIEYKTIFDYLTNHVYISSSNIRKEKLAFIYRCMQADYDSRIVRRMVFQVWDKYFLNRFHIFFSSIKEDFILLFKNL